MRKSSVPAVLVAVLVLAGTALTNGSATDGSGRHGHGNVITLSGKTVQLNLVDVGDPGFTLGDQVAFSDDLAEAKGKPAGFDGGVCSLIRVTDAEAQSGTAQCQVTYSLKGGQVTTQGLLTLTNGGFIGTQTAAITGGTGRFSNATGESTLEFIRPGELRITLTMPR